MIELFKDFIAEAKANQWEPSWPMPRDVFNSDWPWVPVDFEADFEKMHKECVDNDHMFVGHRQQDRHLSYNHEGWAAITLHGIKPSATENYEQYGFKSAAEADYHWTEACEAFPECTKFLKSLNYDKYDRVRIMKLAAGGFITPHVDGPEGAVANRELAPPGGKAVAGLRGRVHRLVLVVDLDVVAVRLPSLHHRLGCLFVEQERSLGGLDLPRGENLKLGRQRLPRDDVAAGLLGVGPVLLPGA